MISGWFNRGAEVTTTKELVAYHPWSSSVATEDFQTEACSAANYFDCVITAESNILQLISLMSPNHKGF